MANSCQFSMLLTEVTLFFFQLVAKYQEDALQAIRELKQIDVAADNRQIPFKFRVMDVKG